jgi:SUN family beta-glucosidase
MKFAVTLALTAAAAQLILAQPHGHAHHHKKHIQTVSLVKRDTAIVYVGEDGKVLSLDDVCTGLAEKKLKFKDGDAPSDLCDKPESEPEPSTSAAPEPTTSAAGGAFYEASSTVEASAAESTKTEEASTPDEEEAPKPKSNYSGGKGLDSEFPDGEIDCGTFPSEYGAVPIDYLGMDGYIGIQHITVANGFVQDIVTGTKGESCVDGAMCSYACPPGYLKAQWPIMQGATGQSVGGLECSGGKLRLTNAALSKSLCIKGTGGVQATNKASDVVSICRTDYPGTESETIPIVIEPGETEELACPDSDTYYKWKGMATSAQYYLNPIGEGPESACQWGHAGKPTGNWAPINFGVSKKGQSSLIMPLRTTAQFADPHHRWLYMVEHIPE